MPGAVLVTTAADETRPQRHTQRQTPCPRRKQPNPRPPVARLNTLPIQPTVNQSLLVGTGDPGTDLGGLEPLSLSASTMRPHRAYAASPYAPRSIFRVADVRFSVDDGGHVDQLSEGGPGCGLPAC